MDLALRQIADRIRAAAAEGTLLRLRGAGTKDFYGEPPQGEVLDTRAWTGIVSYEPSELVVTARCGTPLAELEALLAEQGQCLPFEPPRLGRDADHGGTVGGMVAAGLSGPARASVGALRDFVLGAVLVNGRGETLRFGGQVMKNVAGYDVSRVLAGSMGVLGCIAEVSLKVLPVPPAEATLQFECSQADALQLLHAWGGRPLPLNASLWGLHQGAGMLHLRLRGASAAVAAACRELGGQRLNDAEAGAVWHAARDLRLPWFGEAAPARDLWRLSVPQTAAPLDGVEDADTLVEWHGAQRWVLAMPDAAAQWRERARALGGHAVLWRPARPEATQRFDALPDALQRIHAALVREFDPQGVFHARLYSTA